MTTLKILPPDLAEETRARIAHWRGVRGVSLQELAEAVGVSSTAYLSNVLTNRARPLSRMLAFRVSMALDAAPEIMGPIYAADRLRLHREARADELEAAEARLHALMDHLRTTVALVRADGRPDAAMRALMALAAMMGIDAG